MTAVGVMFSVFGVTMSTFATAFGKNEVGMFSTIFGTLVHFIVVNCIFDSFTNKMIPIGIASGLQFFARAFSSYIQTMLDEKCKSAFIPYSDPASWEDLGEIYRHGFNTLLLRTMGWWAFDVFTQLAATLPT